MPASNTTKRLFQAVDALDQQDSADKRACRRPATASKRNAEAAQSQVEIYQTLVECRILLQRCRNSSKDDNEDPVDEQKQQQQQQQGSERLPWLGDQVLEHLIKAREHLHRIGQDQQEEGDRKTSQSDSSSIGLLLRGDSSGTINVSDQTISDRLQQWFAEDRVDWKEVLDRRHKDVRLHAGAVTSKQFQSLDASFFDQVQAAVEHEKTRFHRCCQREVDDTRLYQQILKDFVGSSQSSANGLPMRAISTRKANVDRKASKGRKIRYAEIPKLLHFTFPLSRPETDLETNAWFCSLFGGAVNALSSQKRT